MLAIVAVSVGTEPHWRIKETQQRLCSRDSFVAAVQGKGAKDAPRNGLLLEVGANDGAWSDYTMQLLNQTAPGASIQLYMFEPEPGFKAKLHAVAAKWPQSNIIRAAAWKEDTNLTFYRARNNRASSIFERGGQGKDQQTKAITVRAVNLVAFMQRVIKPGDVVLMKMDIEGAEYEILPLLISSALLCKLTSAVFEWHPNVLSQEQLPIHHFKLKAELDAQLSTCGTIVDHELASPISSVVQPKPRRHSYNETILSFSRPPAQ